MAFQDEGSLYELYRANCMTQRSANYSRVEISCARTFQPRRKRKIPRYIWLTPLYFEQGWHQRECGRRLKVVEGERRWIFVFSYVGDRMTAYELDLKMQVYAVL
ncbi:hypothetical protein BT96DRAFT_523773 [Gymnopus androsaceus JB14]|uniref:Uncharacterized protein n=1 Tax=Gymnopus androsaceus JB14 TaxID=1447944 RepID=A0A6A4GMC5_9AGAR|nr:hypothetical protein BT96DRAFT_523773 [Gymnopus androsaceus JB14]